MDKLNNLIIEVTTYILLIISGGLAFFLRNKFIGLFKIGKNKFTEEKNICLKIIEMSRNIETEFMEIYSEILNTYNVSGGLDRYRKKREFTVYSLSKICKVVGETLQERLKGIEVIKKEFVTYEYQANLIHHIQSECSAYLCQTHPLFYAKFKLFSHKRISEALKSLAYVCNSKRADEVKIYLLFVIYINHLTYYVNYIIRNFMFFNGELSEIETED